jgi:catechol 2,3-dioxygenase-like lactoylglutathione lyase family enzyme
VSDLDRSLRFYCEGLGFTQGDPIPIDNTFADALEVPRDVVLISQFIRKEGMTVELLAYQSPGVDGTPSQRRNQLGLTHLSFYVPDVDAVAATLVALGGTRVESTHTKTEGIEILFLADPDGTRVELMKAG